MKNDVLSLIDFEIAEREKYIDTFLLPAHRESPEDVWFDARLMSEQSFVLTLRHIRVQVARKC